MILTDPEGKPRLVLNADGFLREVLLGEEAVDPLSRCHRPIIIDDAQTSLGETIPQLSADGALPEDDVVDRDIILVWAGEKRIITGADLLGRLFRGIVRSAPLGDDLEPAAS